MAIPLFYPDQLTNSTYNICAYLYTWLLLLERKTDGDYLLRLVKEANESPPTTEPTIEEDDTRIQLQPFKHKEHIIPVENDYYKCPWCFRIFGNRQGPVRCHLKSESGHCYRKIVSNDTPTCYMCKAHYSTIASLLRHWKNYNGNCSRLFEQEVDCTNQGKSLFVCFSM